MRVLLLEVAVAIDVEVTIAVLQPPRARTARCSCASTFGLWMGFFVKYPLFLLLFLGGVNGSWDIVVILERTRHLSDPHVSNQHPASGPLSTVLDATLSSRWGRLGTSKPEQAVPSAQPNSQIASIQTRSVTLATYTCGRAGKNATAPRDTHPTREHSAAVRPLTTDLPVPQPHCLRPFRDNDDRRIRL